VCSSKDENETEEKIGENWFDDHINHTNDEGYETTQVN
jgi:hypothetical protein